MTSTRTRITAQIVLTLGSWSCSTGRGAFFKSVGRCKKHADAKSSLFWYFL